MKFSAFALCGLAMLLPFSVANAEVIRFGSVHIDANTPATVSDQLSVDVTDAGDGLVSFEFFNEGPLGTIIARIFWDSSQTYESIVSLPSNGNWQADGSPPVLPGGTLVDFESDLSASANASPVANGIDVGESAVFVLDTNATLAQTIADLKNGNTRIGMHLIAFSGPPTPGSVKGAGVASSFVTVPEPGSLAVIAVASLGLLRRRR